MNRKKIVIVFFVVAAAGTVGAASYKVLHHGQSVAQEQQVKEEVLQLEQKKDADGIIRETPQPYFSVGRSDDVCGDVTYKLHDIMKHSGDMSRTF